MFHKLWQKLDDQMKLKFNGDYGEAAYSEALTIVFMYFAHELILHKAPRENHPHINAAWYGSLFSNHRLHPVRVLVQDKIAQLGQATYDPEHNRLHAQFRQIGDKVHNKVVGWAQDRNHGSNAPLEYKAGWVDERLEELNEHIDGYFEPPKPAQTQQRRW